MSWLLGSTTGRDVKDLCPAAPAVSIETEGLRLYAGGISSTFRWGYLPGGELYIVLGYPLYHQDESYLPLTDQKLRELLSGTDPVRCLDGHFLILIVNRTGVLAYNDALGKRTLYIQQKQGDIFFSSSLVLFKKAVKPELDYEVLGLWWQTRFPPGRGKYSPSLSSYYRDTQVMGTGAFVQIDQEKITLRNQLFNPAPARKDIFRLVESCCLIPVQAQQRIAISMSGGMDIRPLLAVYLRAGIPLRGIHYGTEDTQDYRIAGLICREQGIEFRHIGYDETEEADPWAQACRYMNAVGLSGNPVNAPYEGFYSLVAQDNDVLISGYFGELYRIRFYLAHLLSLIKIGQIKPEYLDSFLYTNAPPLFKPEFISLIQKGYREGINAAWTALPARGKMNNAMWLNLLLARYTPFSISQFSLAHLDQRLVDFMPWLQSEIIAQHWHYSLAGQMGEGIHRGLIKRNFPALAGYPLAAHEVAVPYLYRPYMLKLHTCLHRQRVRAGKVSRTTRFLGQNRQQILDLFHSRRVQDYEPYDLIFLKKSLDDYYRGSGDKQGIVMSWLAFELGR